MLLSTGVNSALESNIYFREGELLNVNALILECGFKLFASACRKVLRVFLKVSTTTGAPCVSATHPSFPSHRPICYFYVPPLFYSAILISFAIGIPFILKYMSYIPQKIWSEGYSATHELITCFLMQYCILFFGVLQPLQNVSNMGYVTYSYPCLFSHILSLFFFICFYWNFSNALVHLFMSFLRKV